MAYLLNIFYATALVVASPWLLYRYLRFGKNRRGWTQKLWGLVPHRESNGECVWFHAVSVGEVNLLAPVLKQLQQQRPDIEIVVSTTTETGYDLARQKYADYQIFFFPFDFTWSVRTALHRVRPNLVVLAELEIWPNFIRLASTRCPVAVINGRLSEASFRGYQKFSWLLRSSFQSLRLVAAQNDTYAQRFRELNCQPTDVIVTGSVKYDGMETDRKNQKTIELGNLANVQANEFVFLAGSTQFEEDILAVQVYLELAREFPQLRLVLAPRHPERCEVLIRKLHEMGVTTQLRSQCQTVAVCRGSYIQSDSTADSVAKFSRRQTDAERSPVWVIDVIGELGSWWGVADVAYVGGSIGTRGGQNMIEPAAYGIPVSFGPNTDNFKVVVDQLLATDGATVVRDQRELGQFIKRAICDADWARESGSRAQQEMRRHLGASGRTVTSLLRLLSAPVMEEKGAR